MELPGFIQLAGQPPELRFLIIGDYAVAAHRHLCHPASPFPGGWRATASSASGSPPACAVPRNAGAPSPTRDSRS